MIFLVIETLTAELFKNIPYPLGPSGTSVVNKPMFSQILFSLMLVFETPNPYLIP